MYNNPTTYNPYINDVWVNPISVSNWENSYFGGSEKILIDYPTFESNPNIIIELPKTNRDCVPVGHELKLINLFLKEYGDLLKRIDKCESLKCRIVKIKQHTCIHLNRDFLTKAIDELSLTNFEIGQLFVDYENYIKDTTIYVILPNKDDKRNGGVSQETKDKIEKELDKTKKEDFERIDSWDTFDNLESELNKIKFDKNNKKVESESLTDKRLFNDTKFFNQTKLKPTTYGQFENSMSNHLVRLLDINFQPKSDVITNLKNGKLDIRKLGEIPGGNTNVYLRMEENQSTRPFNVCILCDESGSMQGAEIKFQHKLVKILYKTFSQILSPENIFIYGHTGERYPEIYVYNQPGNTHFDRTIDNMKNDPYIWVSKDPDLIHRAGNNYDGPVIENVYHKVREFSDENILFIVLSDGQPCGSGYGGEKAIKELNQIIEKCRRDNFVTVGIGIGENTRHIPDIYNYHHIIDINDDNQNEIVKSISTLINKVVKIEFKD